MQHLVIIVKYSTLYLLQVIELQEAKSEKKQFETQG